jgi:hypothetical protein
MKAQVKRAGIWRKTWTGEITVIITFVEEEDTIVDLEIVFGGRCRGKFAHDEKAAVVPGDEAGRTARSGDKGGGDGYRVRVWARWRDGAEDEAREGKEEGEEKVAHDGE